MANKWYAYIFRENIYGIGIQAVTFIAGILSTLIFPNLLGRDGFGYFSLAVGIATMGLYATDFGIPNALLRFVPEGAKKGNAWKYFRFLFTLKVASSAIAALALFFGAEAIAGAYHSPALAEGLRFGALFLFAYSLLGFLDNTFVAIKKAKKSLIMDMAYHGFRLLFPVAVFFAYRQDYVGAMMGLAAGTCMSVLPAAIAAWLEPAFKQGKDVRMDFRALREYIMFGTLFIIAYGITQWADTLLLGLFRPVSDVSVYRVAWLWAFAPAFLFPFSQRIFLSAHAYEDKRKSRRLFDVTLRYGFVFAFLMLAGTFLVSGQFLGIIYGHEFDQAYPLIVILSVLVIEMTLNTLTSGLFVGKGDMRTPGWAAVAAAVGQVALVILLTPLYGVVGTAVGVVIPRILIALWQAVVALRFVSLRLPPSYVYRPALCAGAAIALLLPFRQYTFSLLPATAYGIAAVVAYCALAVALKAVDLDEIVKITHGAIS